MKHIFDKNQAKGIHYVSGKPERVIVSNLFSIEIPAGFSYSTDPDVNTTNHSTGATHLLQAHKGKDYDFSEAYEAEMNIVVFGQYQLINEYEIGANKGRKLAYLNALVSYYNNNIMPNGCSYNIDMVKETENIAIAADLNPVDSSLFFITLEANNFMITGQILGNFDEMGEKKAKEYLTKIYNSIEAISHKDLCNCDDLIRLPDIYRLDFSDNKYVDYNDIRIPVPKGFSVFTDMPARYGFGITVASDDYTPDKDPLDARIIFNISKDILNIDDFDIDVDLNDADSVDNVIQRVVSNVPNFKNNTEFFTAKYSDCGIIVTWLSTTNDCTRQLCNTIIFSKSNVYTCNFVIKYNSPISDDSDTKWDADRLTMSFLSRILFDGESSGSASSKPHKASFTKADPKEELYPHYHHLGDTSAPRNGGGFMIITNSGGTEYEFYHIVKNNDDDDFEDDDDEAPSIDYEAILDADTGYYDLDETAERIKKLFHVTKKAFNPKHDRENEISRRMIHKAYMMSALRSFTWTALDYCGNNDLEVEDLSAEELEKIIAFIKKREWLNYKDNGLCDALCGVQDLHVYYLPDSVPDSIRQALLPDEDALEQVRSIKAKFPSYNEILSDVCSLDDLRDDLKKIEPAIEALADSLEESRNYDEELTGGAADVVYAWCSLAIAAKEPFFSEDGPMQCWFEPVETPEKKEAEKGRKCREQTTQREEKWMEEYGEYLETEPDISFDNTLFVFTGLGGKSSEKEDPLVKKVIKAGGQYRTSISGKTDYLVVNPEGAGESKVLKAIELQENGGKIRIILQSDLEEALGIESGSGNYEVSQPVKKGKDVKPVSGSKKREKTRTAQSRSVSFRCTTPDWLKEYTKEREDDKKFYNDFCFDPLIEFSNKTFAVDSFLCLMEFEKLRIKDDIESRGGNYIEGPAKSCDYFVYSVSGDELEETVKFKKNGSRLKIIFLEDFNNAIENTDTILEPDHNLDKEFVVLGNKLIKYNGDCKKVTVPEGVISVEGAFKDSKVEEVILPEGIITIGEKAFFSCHKLKRVTIPDSVTEIGKDAFDGCRCLESITLPKNITSIASHAFSYCKKLKRITVPGRIKIINESLFFGCTDLDDVTIEKGITDIESNAFSNCSSLKKLTVPDSVKHIRMFAFNKCTNLESVSLGEGLTELHNTAFLDCPAITELSFPESILKLCELAFRNHPAVEEVKKKQKKEEERKRKAAEAEKRRIEEENRQKAIAEKEEKLRKEYEGLKAEKERLLKIIEENKGGLFDEKARKRREAKKQLVAIEDSLNSYRYSKFNS